MRIGRREAKEDFKGCFILNGSGRKQVEGVNRGKKSLNPELGW